MANVNAMMLVIAREARGLTQTILAKRIGVAQGTLSKMEAGQADVGEDVLDRLSRELHYPAAFFYERPSFRRLPPTFYRKKVRVPGKVEKALEARVNVLRLWLERLARSVELVPPRFPLINLRESGTSAEEAAIEVRRRLNVPAGPVQNLVGLLEAAGIMVIEYDFGSAEIDGFSIWEPSASLPPVILIGRTAPGERQRFTLAHELAHLVLHLHLELLEEPGAEHYEPQADQFAAEFLMPAAQIRGQLVGATLQSLAGMKPYWRTSIQALLKRATSLDLVSRYQTEMMWKRISMNGWRSGTPEPAPVTREVPTMFTSMLDTHLEELGYTEAQLAELLLCRTEELSPWIHRGPGLRVLK